MNSKKLIDDDELNFSHEALLVGTYYNVDFKTLRLWFLDGYVIVFCK